MLIPFGILGASGGGAAGAYELISTTLISTGTNSVTLSSIPQGYKHLQLRYLGRTGASTEANFLSAQFNGDTATNYASHSMLTAPGSYIVSSSSRVAYESLDIGYIPGASSGSAAIQGAGIIDILDYSSAAKFKTTRSFSVTTNAGTTNSYRVALTSGLWQNTSAITSIKVAYTRNPGENSFQAGSRVSLYGIRG